MIRTPNICGNPQKGYPNFLDLSHSATPRRISRELHCANENMLSDIKDFFLNAQLEAEKFVSG